MTMDELSYKVRIAALWLIAIMAFFAYRTVAVSEQAREVSLLGNQDVTSYLAVMMAFAFLSLILMGRLNRSMNMIAGGIFLVLQVIMLADGLTGYPSGTFNAMTGVSVVALGSIVWFALRWPRGSTAPRRETDADIRIGESRSKAHVA
jgi:hypothetical protein